MKIYLVRHAEKESEGENPNLTRKGIKQAKLLAKRLKELKVDEFYCSDLNRAKQTSEIISKWLKLKPKIKSSLNEFESSDIKKDKSKWNKEERKRLVKLISLLKKITEKPEQESNILIVAHGITNRIIISSLLKISMKRTIVFRQNESCINFLNWSEKFKNWQLEKMNDNSHIPRRLR